MLSRQDGLPYTPADMKAGLEYAQRFDGYWVKYNDRIFSVFARMGFDFAEFWIAYFVRPRNSITPISDPLTIFIDENFDDALVTLVHELTHIVMTYPGNETITGKIMDTLNARFPALPLEAKYEIFPALVSRQIGHDILGIEKTETIQARERDFPILGDAWKIIDASPEALSEKNPIVAVGKLRS